VDISERARGHAKEKDKREHNSKARNTVIGRRKDMKRDSPPDAAGADGEGAMARDLRFLRAVVLRKRKSVSRGVSRR
jgi:hypothetical protein